MDSKFCVFKGYTSNSYTAVSLSMYEQYFLYCSVPKIISCFFSLFTNLIAALKDYLYKNYIVAHEALSNNNKTINAKVK